MNSRNSILQSALLSKHPRLAHGFSRIDEESPGRGNMSLSTGQFSEVLKSRELFCEKLGVEFQAMVMADQVHSARVLRVTRADRGKGATTFNSPLGQADGLCTNDSNLPLTVIVADCAAVFLFDSTNQAIGLAHSGWRGTAGGIGPHLVKVMGEHFGTRPKDLIAWISPCIGPDAFEVGHEVVEVFRHQQPDLSEEEDWFRLAPGQSSKWLLDLKRIIVRQLLGTGIPESRMDWSQDCTYQVPKYFSYRRDRKGTGHSMALIAMKE